MKIWDFDVLQEKARPYGDLYKDFEKLAQAEVERRAAGTTTLEGQNDRDESANLIQQLEENEKNGGLSSSEYGKLCLTVFTFLLILIFTDFSSKPKQPTEATGMISCVG